MGKVKQKEILTDEELEAMMLESQMVVQDVNDGDDFIDADVPEDDYIDLSNTF